MLNFRPLIKICGITKVEQAIQIANLGVDAIGIISVKESPRFISYEEKNYIFKTIEQLYPKVKRVSVYKDHPLEIFNSYPNYKLNENVIQLHGNESPDYCKELKHLIPEMEIWKAFRLKAENQLEKIKAFEKSVDSILLDSFNHEAYGGTGKRIEGIDLRKIKINTPWWLAGGVSIEWIDYIIKYIKPNGVDISSSIEIAPGDKDLKKTELLIEKINSLSV